MQLDPWNANCSQSQFKLRSAALLSWWILKLSTSCCKAHKKYLPQCDCSVVNLNVCVRAHMCVIKLCGCYSNIPDVTTSQRNEDEKFRLTSDLIRLARRAMVQVSWGWTDWRCGRSWGVYSLSLVSLVKVAFCKKKPSFIRHWTSLVKI